MNQLQTLKQWHKDMALDEVFFGYTPAKLQVKYKPYSDPSNIRRIHASDLYQKEIKKLRERKIKYSEKNIECSRAILQEFMPTVLEEIKDLAQNGKSETVRMRSCQWIAQACGITDKNEEKEPKYTDIGVKSDDDGNLKVYENPNAKKAKEAV